MENLPSGKSILNNSSLTTEEYQSVDEAVHTAAWPLMIARELFGSDVRTVPLGKRELKFHINSKPNTGAMDYEFVEALDSTDAAATTVRIPILQKDFHISMLDIESARTEGRQLDMIEAMLAAKKLGELEEDFLLDGWEPRVAATYEQYGLYQNAKNSGNHYSTSKDMSTAGNAVAAVGGAQALMAVDGCYAPMNLVLYPTQYAEVMSNVLSGSGIPELQVVQQLLGTAGKVIQASIGISDTTGLILTTPGRGHRRLTFASDIQTMTVDNKWKGVDGKVFEALAIEFFDANAGCAMSAI